MEDDISTIRGDKSIVMELDKKWRIQTGKSNKMPERFEMNKREWKEYSKNLGEKMTKRANQGMPIFRGARVVIKGE